MPWITGTPKRITIAHFCDQTKAPDGGASGTKPFGVNYKRYKQAPAKTMTTAANKGSEHEETAKAEQQQEVKGEQETQPQHHSQPEQQKLPSATNHQGNDTADPTVKRVDNRERIEPEQSGQHDQPAQPVQQQQPVQLPQFTEGLQWPNFRHLNLQRIVNNVPALSTFLGPHIHEGIGHEPPIDDPVITGIPFPPCDGIADIFRPRVCYYDSRLDRPGSDPSLDSRRRAPQLDHLDIVKIWRGLSSEKAEELVFWEAIFRKVLGDQLQGQFQLFYQYSQSTNYLQPLPDPTHSNDDIVQSFPLNIVDIATSMIRQAKQRGFGNFRWFLSGDIHTTVAQFVLTHDCFDFARPAVDGLSISAKLKQPENGSGIAPVPAPRLPVDVCWNPDYLCFDEWNYMIYEGEELHLIPHYRSSSGFNTSAHGLTSPLVVFATTATWLRWNSQIAGFAGIVPFFSDSEEHALHPNANVISSRGSTVSSQIYTLQITVKAIATDYFDADVRYEQTVRTRVTINVSPRPSQTKDHPPGDQVHQKARAGSEGKWPESFQRELYVGQDATSGPVHQKAGPSDGTLPKHHSNGHVTVFPLRYCANPRHISDRQGLAETDKLKCPGEQSVPPKSGFSKLEKQIATAFDATKQPPTPIGHEETLSSISKKLRGFAQDQISSSGYMKDDMLAPNWRTKRQKRKNMAKKARSSEVRSEISLGSSEKSRHTSYRSGSSSTCQGEYLASTSFGAYQNTENNVDSAPVRFDSACSVNGAITPPQRPPHWRNRLMATRENLSSHREISLSAQIPSAQVHGNSVLPPAGEDFSPFLIRGEDRARFVQMLRDRFTEEYEYTDSELEGILACSTQGDSAVDAGNSPCADDDDGYEPSGDTDAEEVDDFGDGVTLPGSTRSQGAFL